MGFLRTTLHSISGLRLLMVLSMLIVYLTAIGVIYNLVTDYYDPKGLQSYNSVEHDLHLRAEALTDVLLQIRGTVENIANRPEVKNLLQFGSSTEMEDWALNARQFFPDSLGVGLMRDDGEIAGDITQLRIGNLCVIDLQHTLTGEHLPWPVIHREFAGLEHFDIIVPSLDGDEQVIGYLFVSIRLAMLERWLTLYTRDNETLVLTDHAGDVVGRHGTTQDDAATFVRKLEGLELTLNLSKPAISPVELSTKLTLYKFAFFVLIVLAPILISLHFGRIIRRDLLYIHNSLHLISQQNYDEIEPHKAMLLDTESIHTEIQQLVKQLSSKQASLTFNSNHDPLTGLHNRRHMEEHLEHSCALVERGLNFRLVLLDLDNFKTVNDTYGHAAGDELLKTFAESVTSVIRDSDYAARYAGDEFILLLYEPAPTPRNRKVLERLMQTFKEFQLDNNPRKSALATLSIGTVRLSAEGVNDVVTAMRLADEALYKAKANGRDQIVDYEFIGDEPCSEAAEPPVRLVSR